MSEVLLNKEALAITEFDKDPIGVIDPVEANVGNPRVPKIIVSCFAFTQFERLKQFVDDITEIDVAKYANLWIPIFRGYYKGVEIGLVNAYVGGAGCVGLFEEIFGRGAETVILYGNCGVLTSRIEDLGIIIPTSAIRDEGTSFHYAPPSREIDVNVAYGDLFEDLLKELRVPYHKGKVWTTDGFFRETRQKVERRKQEGAIAVEMEIAPMAALAQFRHKNVLQFLYAGDNLDVPVWDERSLSQTSKVEEKDVIGRIALEAALRIAEKAN